MSWKINKISWETEKEDLPKTNEDGTLTPEMSAEQI